MSEKGYQFLFGMHEVAHKRLEGSGEAAFDGLCLDGAANYAKLLNGKAGWGIADFKARRSARPTRSDSAGGCSMSARGTTTTGRRTPSNRSNC